MSSSKHDQDFDIFSQSDSQFNGFSDPSFGSNDDFGNLSISAKQAMSQSSSGGNSIASIKNGQNQQKTNPTIFFIFICIFLVPFLWIATLYFGDYFTHISNNEEFDHVAEALGFEVTRQEATDGVRSVATLETCTVTFEASNNNEAATNAYFDLGGSDFGGRKSSLLNISSSVTSKDSKTLSTKFETTVFIAQMPIDSSCESKVDELAKLLGYDSMHFDHPILDEIGRRFSMHKHGL